MYSPIVKIITKRMPESMLPVRVVAYRQNGTLLEAGDRLLKDAVITLFSLITGEQLTPKDISQYIRRRHIWVHKRVLRVL